MNSLRMDTAISEQLDAFGLDRARLPRHVAIIMDGNGRWARGRGLPRVMGHRAGSEAVRPIVELILVYTYIDERRYDDAITLAQDLADKYPKNTLARVQLGRAWSRKGKYAKAIEVFREVETLQPDNKVIGYYLGANLMYDGGELDEAETYLRAFIASPPGTDWRAWAYERLGDLYVKRKKPELALFYWKKASRDNPDDDTVQSKINRAKKKGVVAATKEPPPPPEPIVPPVEADAPVP